MYYDTEQPIPTETDLVSRRLRLGSALVSNVLKEFFILKEDGWHQARCDMEIREYKAKVDIARSNGKLGGRPKKTQSVILANPEITGSKTNQNQNQNQLNTLSGKPDPQEKKPSLVVLEHLNLKSGRSFKPVAANLKLIESRLKEASLAEVLAVIDRQAAKWGNDEKMAEYLRPATLFAARNFASYDAQPAAPVAMRVDL